MMPEEQPHPTEVLDSDIYRFTEDIESLQTTLPLFVGVARLLRTDAANKYKAFMDGHATLVGSDGEKQRYEYNLEHIKRTRELKHAYNNSRNACRLIPRQYVISLVAQFDSFLGKLMRFVFEVNPKILNTSGKTLSFTELMKFPSIDAARTYIIEKEIETVGRKNHAEQFAWFKDKLRTPFNKGLQCWPTFIELTERRNLFVHTDGTVSSQYISVCGLHKASMPANISVGSQLEVPNDYYQEAYKCIYEIGVTMAHIIWRRLCPEQLEASDQSVIDLTFGLLEKQEYDLAIRILKHFTERQVKHASDTNRRIMLINLAQAYKWNKRQQDCASTLGAVEWDACDDKFALAVATLQDNHEDVYRIMKRLRHVPDFDRSFYRDWPLFNSLRLEDGFHATFEECYGEPFAAREPIEEEEPKEDEGVCN